jgi:hypothetical protein
MKLKTCLLVCAAALTLHGCIPFYGGYNEQNLYAPGGALADKDEGSMVLASANETSLNAMFPKGTSKAAVMQGLGNPMSSTTSSDGTSSQVFSHTFTSYSRKTVQMQMATMTYDKSGNLDKVTFSNTVNNWQ